MDQQRELGPVREPIVDGIFYPAEPKALRHEIRRLLAESTSLPGHADAIIVPHASLSYCGAVLAEGYRAVAHRSVGRVLLLGPVYRDPEPLLILPESRGFSSPLGVSRVLEVAADSSETGQLPIIKRDIPHLEEHCLEIHLPFIQYLFPNAGIVPVLVGDESEAMIEAVKGLLSALGGPDGEDVLTVVSFNLTSTVDRLQAKREAGRVVDSLLSLDSAALSAGMRNGSLSAKGVPAVAAVVDAFRPNHRIELLLRDSSASQLDDPTSTVEYGSFALIPKAEARRNT